MIQNGKIKDWFKGIQPQTIDLDRITMFVGQNNSGKTRMLEAIQQIHPRSPFYAPIHQPKDVNKLVNGLNTLKDNINPELFRGIYDDMTSIFPGVTLYLPKVEAEFLIAGRKDICGINTLVFRWGNRLINPCEIGDGVIAVLNILLSVYSVYSTATEWLLLDGIEQNLNPWTQRQLMDCLDNTVARIAKDMDEDRKEVV